MAVRWIWSKEVAGRLQMQETGRMLAVGGEQAGTVSSMRSTAYGEEASDGALLGYGDWRVCLSDESREGGKDEVASRVIIIGWGHQGEGGRNMGSRVDEKVVCRSI